MSKSTVKSRRVADLVSMKFPAWNFVFAPPVRAGACAAFKLPSNILGESVLPPQRPTPEQGASLV